MTKFKCPCKYTYDPEKGDPKQNIPPGTPFEDLPDTWRCPRCKRKKEKLKSCLRTAMPQPS
jgi:rubredoxin